MIEKKHLITTDMLKAIAIVLIIVNHVAWPKGFTNEFMFPLWVYQNVPIFMIITGIHYSISLKNIEDADQSIIKWYEKNIFTRKLRRILLPYSVAFAIIIIYRFLHGYDYTLITIIKNYIVGGPGPGGYYTPLIIQILVIFPIIYRGISKRPLSIIYVVFLSIVYEFICKFFGLSAEFYRIFFMRHVVTISLGIILVQFFNQLKNTVIPYIALITGSIYLLGVTCLGYSPKLVTSWVSTSFFASPYAFGIVFLFMKLERALEKLLIFNRLCWWGGGGRLWL